MASNILSKEGQIFAKYLEGKKILIADGSSSSRSGLHRAFQDLGAKTSQMILVNSFNQAQEQMKQQKPHLVISEFDLGKKCGLELFQSQRELFPEDSKNIVFVIVTGNSSQSAVARAAEEDIDAYILKPFTPEILRQTLLKAVVGKIQPPPYVLALNEGKEFFKAGKIDEAEQAFIRASTLDPAPSLAQYYLGQIKFFKKIFNDSEGAYSKGLSFNKIHYKCLIGLYELLMTQKMYPQAYEIVKRVSQYFPANPKRLSEVLRLAIMNGKYEDIERYYAIFCTIEDREEVLIKYICAALVVCGKYYLSVKMKSRAIELFQKASATGTGRINILKEIVQALTEANLIKDAKEFLAKIPAALHGGKEYQLLSFFITNAEGNISGVIVQGRALMKQGFYDEKTYDVMIKRSIEAKLLPAAETLIYDAIQKFPKNQEYYNGLLSQISSGEVKSDKKASA